MPETSQLPPVSQPSREKSRYLIGKVWIPHPSRVRSVLLIRPDDELSLAWPFPRSAQGGWLCLTCGRVACSDDFPNQHAGACPHRRWCSVRQRTAQPTCWLQSAPTPESLQSAASTTRCPHYRRLAITDEASPFALRSTRNRPRTAMHHGCDLLPREARSLLVMPRRSCGRTACPLSAICQHASLATPCAPGRRLDLSVLTSWDDVVRSMAVEGSVWGPHSLHCDDPARWLRSGSDPSFHWPGALAVSCRPGLRSPSRRAPAERT